MPNNVNKSLNNELVVIENKFKNNITNLALESTKNDLSLTKENLDLVKKQVHKDFHVDVEELSRTTNELLNINNKMSDELIAIELLKKIASNNDSKFMKKLASEMIKEEWWKK